MDELGRRVDRKPHSNKVLHSELRIVRHKTISNKVVRSLDLDVYQVKFAYMLYTVNSIKIEILTQIFL